jgi:2-polyprenyl-3-methyl-5-hydroxy-6-metoxy-1,4-benzoquinol methylase
MEPFIDFYNKEKILPVRQNTDNPNFLPARSFLYSRLGVPLSFLRGLDILEFGPGGGFNAIATSTYKPSSYYFVEGSIVGVEQLKYFEKLKKIQANEIKVFEINFLDFNIDKKFDLVIAEACIPGQKDPNKYLLHISSFVKENGILVTTTTSKSSSLSEILRALYGFLIQKQFKNKDLYADFLELKFSNHLSKLGTNTRSIKDWVLDNIINTYHKDGSIYSMGEVVKTLGNFEFQSSVPSFLLDLSWYKNYKIGENQKNNILESELLRLETYLLDWRVKEKDLLGLSNEICIRINKCIKVVFDEVFKILNQFQRTASINDLITSLNNLKTELPSQFKVTIDSINDFIGFLNSKDYLNYNFSEFESWWGRGQQYVSLRKVK